nr:MAG TPA: hypothetical protein [Caudoviricetes sp.]
MISFKIHQPNLKNCCEHGLAGEILYVIRPKSDAYFLVRFYRGSRHVYFLSFSV